MTKAKPPKGKKKIYKLTSDLIVEYNALLKINVSDLGIYPEFMTEETIKKMIAQTIADLLPDSFIEPIAQSVKLVGADTRSTTKPEEED
jgi:hypothetical protein